MSVAEPGVSVTKPANSDLEVTSNDMKRVALASFIGSTIEWYDFFLYASAAALVFSSQFFPSSDPLSGTLLAFATFGVAFVARPIGGIVAGHLGDRIGRKRTLIFTLLLTGISTGLIGFVPTTAHIGVIAPILLVVLRTCQGLGVGGEWGGGALIAVEHAPRHRRGFYGTWPQLGTPAGMLLATAAISAVSALPNEDFLSWGWRLPFIASFALVGVGIYIRLGIAEPAVFKIAQDNASAKERLPILTVLRHYPRTVLLAAGIRFSDNVLYYTFAIFSLTYLTTALDLPRSTALWGVLTATFLELFTMPMFGALSDRVGRKPVVAVAAIATIASPFIWFPLVNTRNPLLIIVASVIVLSIVHSAVYSCISAWLAEMFGTKVRYSGISLGYQLGSLLAAAPVPLIATAMLQKYPSSIWPLAMIVVIGGTVTLVSALAARDDSQKVEDPLDREI